jgi:hypothetical protein
MEYGKLKNYSKTSRSRHSKKSKSKRRTSGSAGKQKLEEKG